MAISGFLRSHGTQIRQYMECSDAQWASMARLIASREQARRPFDAEKPWTFAFACGYAMAREAGVDALARVLTGSDPLLPISPRIWFEGMAIEPRQREGKTHVDLAVGAIRRLRGTSSGIELEPRGPDWICFAEAKWKTDAQPTVTYDLTRNQLARDIENALCFQTAGHYAGMVYMSIIIPPSFSWQHSLLGRKLREYRDKDRLLRDLSTCPLEKNQRPGWQYPSNMDERASALRLTQISYSDLCTNLPESPLRAALQDAWQAEIQQVPHLRSRSASANEVGQ